MRYYLCTLITFVSIVLFCFKVNATDTNSQTNTSGSNTNITGGYTSTTTNTYSGGQTNTTTSTTSNASTTNGSDIPPPSANSPSYSSMSQDVCSMGVSGSLSTGVVGFSGGKHVIDENCERIKLAKVLQDFGMKVASVAILCQDARVFAAMESAGTPCPFAGKIGDEAKKLWATYPMLRPDYETYLERKEVVTEVNEKIREQKEKEEAELAKKEAEERAAEALRLERELLTLKEKDEVENIEPIADSPVINVHE